ncbi:hypothetical protein NKI15_02950 [Mesorhizobium sp. M0862]|uniref:hypothetical protein n=1 Tax=Mesorhizobium sp. M0862 TaxID=2957015 RepID=UPI00333CA6FC
MAKTPRKSTSAHGQKQSARRAPLRVRARRLEALSDLLPQQREILEQIDLCSRLLCDLPELNQLSKDQRAATQATISMWHEALVLAAARNVSLVRSALADIPDEPDPMKRAVAFRPIVGACVDALDPNPSDNTKRFLLHVAWHEGDKLRTRVQYGDGPARSFFQFEAYRAKEAMQYARQAGYIDKLAGTTGNTKKELKDSEDDLPGYDPKDSSCSYFPDGNLIRTLLEQNDQFGAYLVRIAFKKVAAAIGQTNAEHADYWYTYWKVSGGDPDALKKVFAKEANEVDKLVAQLF